MVKGKYVCEYMCFNLNTSGLLPVPPPDEGGRRKWSSSAAPAAECRGAAASAAVAPAAFPGSPPRGRTPAEGDRADGEAPKDLREVCCFCSKIKSLPSLCHDQEVDKLICFF